MSSTEKKKITAVMPQVAFFIVEYEDESELKAKICKHLGIEPEFTNLIFTKTDEDFSPIGSEDLDDFEETEAINDVIVVDYIWARQMIVLKDDQRKLRSAHALIVGCGALGNELVKNLAWLGFGNITIVDFDEVEYSNVSRGLFEKEDIGKNKAEVLAEKFSKNSPYVKITPIAKRVEECDPEELECQVMISALDNMPTRVWLASFCVSNEIPLIDGGIKEFQGRVQTFMPGGSCLACGIPLDRYAEIMELSNPCESLEFGAQGSFTTVSSIVAGISANEAMKVVVGLPTLTGVLVMDFLSNSYAVIPQKRNVNCFVCGKESKKELTVEEEKTK